LLGYSTSEEPSIVRWGPQPWEGYISDVCVMFGIGPVEALDAITKAPNLVDAIADYRAARRAVEEFSADGKENKARAFAVLEKNPGLVRIIGMMHRAQAGAKVSAPLADLETEGWERGVALSEEIEAVANAQEEADQAWQALSQT
jgi:hypothetical protein